MTRNRSLVLAVLVSGGVLFIFLSATLAEENAGDAAKAKLVKAASDTLNSVQQSLIGGGTTVEDVYLWSHRVMEAEIDNGVNGKVATATHIARMRELQKRSEAKVKLGTSTRHELYATTYYLEKSLLEQQKRSRRF